MPKSVKVEPLGVFELTFFCKIKKMKGGPSETLKKIAKKIVSHAKRTARKNVWSWAGLEPTSFCLADLKKT